MTDINTRGKLPFAVVSSSVNTGYAAELSASVGQNINLVNHHKDEYGELENSPLQSPFTQQHVGGNQHRHSKLNLGTDNNDNRAEGYFVSASANSIKIYGPDIKGLGKPRAQRTRGLVAKSPINIENIQTSGNVAGNFEHNYQVVQSVGRRTTNNLINDNFIASGNLTTQFISSPRQIYALPDIENNSKSIFVQRFNAPGGKQESSRGALDREGEEFAPNNSLTTRNIKVRQPYYNQLTKHNKKFYLNEEIPVPAETNLESFSLSASLYIGAQESFPEGFYFKEDGTEFYIIGKNSDSVFRFQLPVPFDISTASVVNSRSILAQTGNSSGITFSPDGTKMFIVDNPTFGSSKIYRYNLSTPWDITSPSCVFSNSFSFTGFKPTSVLLDNEGSRLFVCGFVGITAVVREYSLSSPWNITSPVLVSTLDVSSDLPTIHGIHFDSSGLELIACGNKTLFESIIVKYLLKKDKDLESAIYNSIINIPPIIEESSVRDVYITPNKNKMFIKGVINDTIYQYNLDNYIFGEHSVNKNSIQRIEEQNGQIITGSINDNFWVQHAIPATDLRYRWIADSVSSSQNPIEYQSYNSLYGTGSLYNSNAAFSDIEFEQKGPFGDHLGISGAIDKNEVWVSTYTNTMYRDKKYFNFIDTSSSLSIPNFNINLDNISADIDNRSFSVSFWYKFGGSGEYEVYDIIRFSGSLGWNRLSIEPQLSTNLPVATYLRVYSNLPTNSGIDTSIWEKTIEHPIIEDGWHFITLVNDINTTATNSITKGEIISVYFDGGLVYQENRPNHKFIIDKVRIVGACSLYNVDGSDGVLSTDTLMDEIVIWDTLLTEEQINNIYKISKADYKQRPKKYFEHQFEGIDIPSPIHLYSSRLDPQTGKLIDELARFDATLQNFVESDNLLPQNSGLISYSTYFDGPYQGASWKSIRKNEHIITRKLNTEDTNIISVVLSDYKTTKRVNESPVQMNNKPLKHIVKLKNSTDPNTNLEIKHSYINNLKYFAHDDLNLSLGLQKNDNQMYNILYGYYTNNVPDDRNPIEKLTNYTYSETIFPNPKIAGLKETRQRVDYITDQPGYSIDGYDRQLGTQRVFWRDNQEDRMRTRKGYINSIGEVIESYYDLPFQTPSVAALEEIKETENISYNETISSSLVDTSFKNAAELNNKLFLSVVFWNSSSNSYSSEQCPVWSLPERYFYKNSSLTSRDNLNVVLLNSGTYQHLNKKDPSCLAVSPRYTYEHGSFVLSAPMNQTAKYIFESSSFDLGLNRNTEKISDINPWYDSYKDYYEDVKLISNSKAGVYGVIPEFKISEKIPSLVKEYAGNDRNITLEDYVDDVNFSIKNINNNNQLSYKDLIEQENSSYTKQDKINIKINGIKKLLPYNGFYPQDYSIKLVNYLKESYIDTAAVKGGFLLQNISGQVVSLNYHTSSDNYLEKYSKESSFLEPFYAPGIFYNLIKSGLAVSWPVYTGSLPVTGFFTNMNKSPDFTLPFETILDIFNGIPVSSSNNDSSNRIMKSRETNFRTQAGDYLDESLYLFQGFFELENKSNPLYSLAINNFLAETINLFLKESKLTSFYSKPETQFSEMSDKKTYYMDVVLKNDSIIMVDAHSSSISDNYGKMRGMYFGPAVWTGSNTEKSDISSKFNLHKILRDPSYCPYTPPYFYGESVATLSFKPFDGTRRYTLDEIINNLTMSNNNKGLIDDSLKYPSGSLYNSMAMPVGSSVDIFGVKETRLQTIDFNNQFDSTIASLRERLGSSVGTATNNTGIKEWVISTKMETPVLDFSDNEYVTSTNILSASKADIELKYISSSHTPATASGFGIGMWSGYGKIPELNRGLYLQLAETYPDTLLRFDAFSKTGSLLQACGFNVSQKRKKIGELNNTAEISEAIVIIPYSTTERAASSVRTGFSTLLINDTIKIENHNLFKINQQMFEHQKQNILQGKSAVSAGSFTTLNPDIQETSISRMIKMMNKYIMPPNFDFLLNSEIKPFVMYIAEFTSKLSTGDLANMWQGVMPSIAMKAEHESQVMSHPNNIFEFFHGQGLPSDIKFMIFKVKKRAEINYYKMTAKSTDDNLFPKIAAGRRESPYSFNWPYDYCSLVETAKVDVELEYVNISGSNS